jgi:hypothetical protein
VALPAHLRARRSAQRIACGVRALQCAAHALGRLHQPRAARVRVRRVLPLRRGVHRQAGGRDWGLAVLAALERAHGPLGRLVQRARPRHLGAHAAVLVQLPLTCGSLLQLLSRSRPQLPPDGVPTTALLLLCLA